MGFGSFSSSPLYSLSLAFTAEITESEIFCISVPAKLKREIRNARISPASFLLYHHTTTQLSTAPIELTWRNNRPIADHQKKKKLFCNCTNALRRSHNGSPDSHELSLCSDCACEADQRYLIDQKLSTTIRVVSWCQCPQSTRNVPVLASRCNNLFQYDDFAQCNSW